MASDFSMVNARVTNKANGPCRGLSSFAGQARHLPHVTIPLQAFSGYNIGPGPP